MNAVPVLWGKKKKISFFYTNICEIFLLLFRIVKMQIEKNMHVQRIHIFTFYYYKKIF